MNTASHDAPPTSLKQRQDWRLQRDYTEALSAHLVAGSEETLERAFEVGRHALEEGAGPLELAAAHSAARQHLRPEDAERAEQFFTEALAPFEMAYRGFREANGRLQEMNRLLEARNTELQRMQEAAEAASRELETFSYSVSHDLRAPVRAMKGFSEALLSSQGDKLDEDGKKYVQFILDAGVRMGRLIDDLLRLAKVAQGELQRDTISVSLLATGLLERLKRAHPERKVETKVQAGLQAYADPRLLEVALTNLLDNAWKFTSKRVSPRIEVGGKRGEKQGELIFYVRDNGAGFDPAHADKLFHAFQRLHDPALYPGTGIGLATVARVVQRHGGRIWAEGTPGGGAAFFFTLGGRAGGSERA